MKFETPGGDTSGVELIGLADDAVRFTVDGESYTLFFAEFPWFPAPPLSISGPSVDRRILIIPGQSSTSVYLWTACATRSAIRWLVESGSTIGYSTGRSSSRQIHLDP